MKTTFGLLMACFSVCCFAGSLFSEPRHRMEDSEISRKMLQTWLAHSIWASVGVPNQLDATVAFTPDGNFITKGVFTIVNDKQPFEYEGKWQIRDGLLIETISKSSRPKLFRVGTVTRDKIVRINGRELVYQTEEGKTVTRKRKTDV